MDDYRQRRTWHVRAVAVHESCWSTASDGVGKLGGVLSGVTRDHTAAGHEPHVTCPSMVLDHGTRKSPLDDQNTSEPSRLLISSPSSKDKTTSKGHSGNDSSNYPLYLVAHLATKLTVLGSLPDLGRGDAVTKRTTSGDPTCRQSASVPIEV
ncbi:hypothetical protein B296_00028632 [Ensete ventricosum]|uniref:Uncharacterized protein n=1 Tax=Ensete ventricosum TaxID=4639 RepID=A0A426XX76_ENSVE|nr:hypothetical protein B296_00028632 [Ensete ventricosum]